VKKIAVPSMVFVFGCSGLMLNILFYALSCRAFLNMDHESWMMLLHGEASPSKSYPQSEAWVETSKKTAKKN
jgi:hypothetical protein